MFQFSVFKILLTAYRFTCYCEVKIKTVKIITLSNHCPFFWVLCAKV